MEFGSDFHLIDYPIGDTFSRLFPNANYYASGRQALAALAITRKWERLWIPSYFCEESILSLSRLGIRLSHYKCVPGSDIKDTISKIKSTNRDAILVVNYFGIDNKNQFDSEAEIIEDHTHNVISVWSLNSSADWCIASLRKTLPIPDGGILWSPKDLELPDKLDTSAEVADVMGCRLQAMKDKAAYLYGEDIPKQDFLNRFATTESAFDLLSLSGPSEYSKKVINNIDLESWHSHKRSNFSLLKDSVKLPSGVTLLHAEESQDTPFSFGLYFSEKEWRDKIRQFLIDHDVYPAILWTIESDNDPVAKQFGDRILSIHCDGRYDESEMRSLCKIINSAFDKIC